MKKYLFAVFVISLFFASGGFVHAQSSQEVRASVSSIDFVEEIDDGAHATFTAVDDEGVSYVVDGSESLLGDARYDLEVGQEVLLQVIVYPDDTVQVFLVDVVRTPSLLWIVLFFAVLVVLVGRKRGLTSLVGLAVTCAILFGVIVPQILNGVDPVLITVIGSAMILLINLPLTHGFNKRTVYAYFSTIIGLCFAWFFSAFFVYFSRLSGLGSEEASLLFLTTDAIELPSGLLLAGIILGAVGVLDDIAITQTETVFELHETNPKLTSRELYKKAMSVGRHHIASVVNTLVLAYSGVALPIFLLFALRDDIGIIRLLNEEIIAEEIIRTIAGTSTLVLLVPIATWFATRVYSAQGPK